MDSHLILRVNKLHQLTQRFSGGPLFSLPQIAVVGDQSAGKSSLLQSFIGKDFLPSGSDKVTRRPIMLQLIHVDINEAKQNGPIEYAIFPEDNKDKKYTDFNVVKQKLHAYMSEVSRSEVVSDATVVVQIYSPYVVTLTLFDLPGLVTSHVADEPEDAPEKIRELVKRHIEPNNVIILAVVAGNTDIVTSSAVKLAEEIDPTGDRTVLAVTKLDDVKDEDAMEKTVNLLAGKTKPYKEGVVGVINRRPDVNSRRTVAEVRAEEVTILQKKFQPLATQKNYGNLRMGSEHLQQLLSKLLVRKISEYCSQELHQNIDQRLEQCNAVLKMYGEGSEKIDREEATVDAIEEFSTMFSEAIIGNALDLTKIKPLIVHSVYETFFMDFPDELQALRNAQIFSDEYIQEMILLAMGPHGHLSAPFNALASMAREYIEKTRTPSKNAAVNVKNGLTFTMEKCRGSMPPKVARFPVLLNAIVQKTAEFLAQTLEETLRALETEISMEWQYININHPDFDKVCAALVEQPHLQAKAGTVTTDTDPRKGQVVYETRRVRDLLTADPKEFKVALAAYIDIIYRNTLAMVPKVIYFHMIKQLKQLSRYLGAHFRKVTDERLFDEPEDIIEKRTEALEGVRECKAAKVELADMVQYCSRREG